jgi:hypothetical protein
MFDNIGGKIKVLSIILCCAGIISFIIVGIFLISKGQPFVGSGVLYMILGPILSWIGCWSMYALGEVAENTAYIKEKLSQISYKLKNKETAVQTKTQGYNLSAMAKNHTTPTDNNTVKKQKTKKEKLSELLDEGLITQEEYDEEMKS